MSRYLLGKYEEFKSLMHIVKIVLFNKEISQLDQIDLLNFMHRNKIKKQQGLLSDKSGTYTIIYRESKYEQ